MKLTEQAPAAIDAARSHYAGYKFSRPSLSFDVLLVNLRDAIP
jgi:hypothetical protein